MFYLEIPRRSPRCTAGRGRFQLCGFLRLDGGLGGCTFLKALLIWTTFLLFCDSVRFLLISGNIAIPKNHFSASVVILYLIDLNCDDFSGVLDNFEKRDKRTVTVTFALDLLPVQFIFWLVCFSASQARRAKKIERERERGREMCRIFCQVSLLKYFEISEIEWIIQLIIYPPL